MFLKLDAMSLLLAISMVGILSFIVSLGLDAIVGEDGFGATGNAVVITAGFFFSMFLMIRFGWNLTDKKFAVACGLVGAFLCLTALMLLKALVKRLGNLNPDRPSA
ncbi:hypothetical protein L611_001900000860 [Aminobacter sp. J15]|jgi:hypothetical protein|nr:hypothetical protein L610_003000000570 [Aminobacter sp. J44]TWH33935.1 hypothetical protein L611_001900000860 [Aminobacter sp. J15]